MPNSKPSKKIKPDDSHIWTEPLEELLEKLRIGRWDYLIVGDGSGSTWKREAGWGSVVIDAATMTRTVFAGAVNRGTVNFAEIMAYLQPLERLANQVLKQRKLTGKHQPVYVHIVTDSEYCRNTGNSSYRGGSANVGLWAVFDAFKRHGLVIRWHWARRESCGLNRYSDRLSKLARLLMKGYNLQHKMSQKGRVKLSVYEINPET